jgi:hypothetical protein
LIIIGVSVIIRCNTSVILKVIRGGIKLKEEVRFISIDAGNSGNKYAYYRGGQIFYGFIPNVTGQAIPLDFPPASNREENILAIQVLSADTDEYRKPVFVGELARQQLQEYAEQDRSRNKVDSDSINLIVPAILGLLDTEEPIVLGIGATLQDYSEQAPQLQKKLTKRHEIKFKYGSRAGQTIKPNVIHTYTYAQAAAGLVGMLRTDDGRLRRNDWNNKTILGIDCGHGQFNIAVMDQLQFIKQSCFSLDYGFYRVVSAVQQHLNKKPYYVTASIPQLQEAVEKGCYLKNGHKIDLEPIIDTACGQLMEMVYSEITSKVSKVLFDKITEVVVMGGGAQIMAPFVGSKLMKPEIADNSLYANARGLLLVAKEKWENENSK